MKLLAFSDLHRDRGRAEHLVEAAREADVVVGAGDCATMRMGLESIEALSAIAVPVELRPHRGGGGGQARELSRGRCPGRRLTSPPEGYLDNVHGRRLGSRALLEAIERKRPALVLCGHIHQCWGEEAEIGTTPVVKVGPEGRFFDI